MPTPEPIETVTTDVLIVGSGAAALRAALEAHDRGAEVLVVIKGEFRRSGATFHSVAEVGAFNVPDDAGKTGDSPEVFLKDILDAAQGMSDPRLSAIVAEEAEDALRYLEGHGVHFERSGDDYLVFRACFSSRPRSHVIKDHFKPIVSALGKEASRRGVKVMDRLMVTNLIVRDGACLGVYALDHAGKPVVIRAKATILTTGGASQLFEKNLYPNDITGDGYAMARRAGAYLANMEFMQAGVSTAAPFVNLFGNYLWDALPNLTDRDGERFIEGFLPEGISLEDVIQAKERHFPFSSSDISRYIEIGIQKTINAGRGTELGAVYMDFIDCRLDAVLADKSRSIAQMWPLTQQWYLERGVDLYKDRFQITCSAHAVNGGIYIDAEAQSNIKGLFAAGEVASGPHGADRLGGNMAMTCQVFGRRAGKAAAERAAAVAHPPVPDAADELNGYVSAFRGDGTADLAAMRSELKHAANRHLLVVRNGDGLESILALCEDMQEAVRTEARIETPADMIAALELVNLCEVGAMMATAALVRTESRGSHYREDFPESDDAQLTNVIIDSGNPQGWFRARIGELG